MSVVGKARIFAGSDRGYAPDVTKLLEADMASPAESLSNAKGG